MSMRLVRCITGREYTPELTVGKKYWIDESSLWKDSDGDEYAEIYTDEKKSHKVGNLLTSHFETIYGYMTVKEFGDNFIPNNEKIRVVRNIEIVFEGRFSDIYYGYAHVLNWIVSMVGAIDNKVCLSCRS